MTHPPRPSSSPPPFSPFSSSSSFLSFSAHDSIAPFLFPAPDSKKLLMGKGSLLSALPLVNFFGKWEIQIQSSISTFTHESPIVYPNLFPIIPPCVLRMSLLLCTHQCTPVSTHVSSIICFLIPARPNVCNPCDCSVFVADRDPLGNRHSPSLPSHHHRSFLDHCRDPWTLPRTLPFREGNDFLFFVPYLYCILIIGLELILVLYVLLRGRVPETVLLATGPGTMDGQSTPEQPLQLKERAAKLESWRAKEELREKKKDEKKKLLCQQSSMWIAEEDLEKRVSAAFVDTSPL